MTMSSRDTTAESWRIPRSATACGQRLCFRFEHDTADRIMPLNKLVVQTSLLPEVSFVPNRLNVAKGPLRIAHGHNQGSSHQQHLGGTLMSRLLTTHVDQDPGRMYRDGRF